MQIYNNFTNLINEDNLTSIKDLIMNYMNEKKKLSENYEKGVIHFNISSFKVLVSEQMQKVIVDY